MRDVYLYMSGRKRERNKNRDNMQIILYVNCISIQIYMEIEQNAITCLKNGALQITFNFAHLSITFQTTRKNVNVYVKMR